MSDIISEALLEMHFFRAQMEYFENIFGADFFRVLKPSTQQEAWVGFDQGWVRASVDTKELFDYLKEAIQAKASSVNHFFLGYFLQFKRVERITRQSRTMPPNYSAPYLRSELSLKPSSITLLSQHETLLRLSRINFTSVSYSCAMVFTLDDIHKKPDLDMLRCVPISSSPAGWATNQRHFIAFRDEGDTSPIWCSQPVEGKALGFKEWAAPDSRIGPKKLTAEEIIRLIETAHEEIKGLPPRRQPPLFKDKRKISTRSLPESLVIAEFVQKTIPRNKPRRMIRVD